MSERTNNDRAQLARRVVCAYEGDRDGPAVDAAIDGEEALQEEILSDFCADIRHLCDALGLDHGAIQERAQACYLGDLAEDGPPATDARNAVREQREHGIDDRSLRS